MYNIGMLDEINFATHSEGVVHSVLPPFLFLKGLQNDFAEKIKRMK